MSRARVLSKPETPALRPLRTRRLQRRRVHATTFDLGSLADLFGAFFETTFSVPAGAHAARRRRRGAD